MERFSRFIIAKRWWVLLVWVLASAGIIGLSPSLSSVESADQSSFLPDKYESVQTQKIAEKISPQSEGASDILVFKNESGAPLTPQEQSNAKEIIQRLNAQKLSRILAITPSPLQAPNKDVVLAQVIYDGKAEDESLISSAKAVREAARKAVSGSTLSAKLTGSVAMSVDTQESFDNALKIVSIGTIILVFVLPMLVFRSPFIGLLPVLSVSLVYSVGSALVADAATWFDFKINQQLSVLFTVVLFGVGTDYILFLLFRYREKLRHGDHSRAVAAYALSRAGTAIMSAALVVMVSFVAMFFAEFGIFSSFAPGLVICVGVMMIAALTLIPALVGIIGPKLFWPSKAWMSTSDKPSISKKIGGTIARYPGRVSLAALVVLLVLAAGAVRYTADFSSVGQAPKDTEAGEAYAQIQDAFPAGVLSPTILYATSKQPLDQTKLTELQQKVHHTDGVAQVLPPTVTPDGKNAIFSVILKDNPFSNQALDQVAGPIRNAAHSANSATTTVYVGGVSAALADVKAATNRDLKVVFPLAAVFIFLILALLLRSVVAPLYLLISVALGFTATLGATVWWFMEIGSEPGLIFFLPIMLYLFVVAIGTDYNILTITRLREEIKQGHNPRKAADLTVEHSSGTVVSAGIILAGTFASLLLARISLLSQMGTAIAVGVCLAAFVIAPIFIPSISAFFGYIIWWPGHRPKKGEK